MNNILALSNGNKNTLDPNTTLDDNTGSTCLWMTGSINCGSKDDAHGKGALALSVSNAALVSICQE
jgi:hypothetical protein